MTDPITVVEKYLHEHYDAPSWGGPTMYPDPPVSAISAVLSMARRPDLFLTGDFTLASGAKSGWKIECDGISAAEWQALAKMASEILPPFGTVEGVPRGGIPFADALRPYATDGPLLICEDVVTTGGSMERYRNGRDAIGVAVFARGNPPAWVTPIFTMTRR